MLTINIEDLNTCNMQEIYRQVREYQLKNGLKVTATEKDNDIPEDRDIYFVDGKSYCNLGFIGYPDYYMCKEIPMVVRKNGEVFKPLKEVVVNRKYHNNRLVTLSYKGKKKSFSTQYLFALCFVPNPYGYEHVKLIDGDANNLNIGNVTWIPFHYNGRN